MLQTSATKTDNVFRIKPLATESNNIALLESFVESCKSVMSRSSFFDANINVDKHYARQIKGIIVLSQEALYVGISQVNTNSHNLLKASFVDVQNHLNPNENTNLSNCTESLNRILLGNPIFFAKIEIEGSVLKNTATNVVCHKHFGLVMSFDILFGENCPSGKAFYDVLKLLLSSFSKDQHCNMYLDTTNASNTESESVIVRFESSDNLSNIEHCFKPSALDIYEYNTPNNSFLDGCFTRKRYVDLPPKVMNEVSEQFDITSGCAYKKAFFTKNRFINVSREGVLLSASEKALSRVESFHAKNFYLDVSQAIEEENFQIPCTYLALLVDVLKQAKKGSYFILNNEDAGDLPMLLPLVHSSSKTDWTGLQDSYSSQGKWKKAFSLVLLLDNLFFAIPLRVFDFPIKEFNQLFKMRENIEHWQYVNLPDKVSHAISKSLNEIKLGVKNKSSQFFNIILKNVPSENKDQLSVKLYHSELLTIEGISDFVRMNVEPIVMQKLFQDKDAKIQVDDSTEQDDRQTKSLKLLNLYEVKPSRCTNCIIQLPFALNNTINQAPLLSVLYFDSLGNNIGQTLVGGFI